MTKRRSVKSRLIQVDTDADSDKIHIEKRSLI